ncbi:hypothetical protein HHK36_033099 [Tetracentron sinense]|uniref:non-specific serine/threonine protein kinase n=1 Tax=Tetracentron sinense TaxID=13715 RepID=A0A834Y6L9_TETSI|nr:hypothetical protein HHK36_033099 [Tetracentron sinense]
MTFVFQVADFGLARFFPDDYTHISTNVKGTFGVELLSTSWYLDPEYVTSGKLTDRSDVFSFGVMLLELITGHRPVNKTSSMPQSLVEWARPWLKKALEDGNFDSLIDPRLAKDYDPEEVTRMVACAAACVNHSARHRPPMNQIVRALEGVVPLVDLEGEVSLVDPNEESGSGHGTNYSSSDYDTTQLNEDIKKHRMLALPSSGSMTKV